MKSSKLENPVLQFGSDTYKCEKDVRGHLRRGVAKLIGGEKDIRSGFLRALAENVPTARFLQWCKDESVPSPTKRARLYDKFRGKSDAWKDQVISGKISWENAVSDCRITKPQQTRDQVGARYRHQLAVWIYLTNADCQATLALVAEEVSQIRNEKENH